MKLTKSQSRTLLNTSLISAVPYSFSCIPDIVELVCFKCAVIVYDEAHRVTIQNIAEYRLLVRFLIRSPAYAGETIRSGIE